MTNSEKESLLVGRRKYLTSVSHHVENEEETKTKPVRRMLSETVPYIEEQLILWKEKARYRAGTYHSALPLLDKLNPTLTSLLISRAVLDTISVPQSMTSLALKIGSSIDQEIMLIEMEKNDPYLFEALSNARWAGRGNNKQKKYFHKAYQKVHKGMVSVTSKDLKVQAGVIGLNLFIKATGLVEIQKSYVPSKGRNKNVVAPTASMIQWLEQAHDHLADMSPFYLPMVEKPLEWESTIVGGYLTRPLNLFKTGDYDVTPESAPMLYKAVNRVQETEWEVNEDMLSILYHFWENKISFGNLPSRELLPMPDASKVDFNDVEQKRIYSYQKAECIAKNNQLKTLKLNTLKTLKLADKFKGQAFYFPQQLDFRGRMYTVPSLLNNQSNDLSRSLLRFHKGKVIKSKEGWDAYVLSGMNHYDILNENTIEGKMSYYEDNKSFLVTVGRDPLSNMSYWSEAKEPLQFLSWLIEHAKIVDDPNYPSKHVCAIDGSNHGCQVWAMILKDEQTASHTNCNGSSEHSDLYKLVAEKLIEELKMSDDYLAKSWLSIGITRETCKKAVMIIPYSATISGVTQTIKSHLDKLKASGYKFPWRGDMEASRYLALKLMEIIPNVIPAVMQGLDFLKELAHIGAKHGEALSWELPTGLKPINKYMNTKYRKIKTRLDGKYSVSYLKEPTQTISTRTQKRTLPANFTHSYDACLLMHTVANVDKQVNSFSMIHDSYGTHAEDLPKISLQVRKSAEEIFSPKNILTKVRDSLIKAIGSEEGIPLAPPQGELDLKKLKSSTYFFH